MGYPITTRADGTLLTAAIYMADHQVHPDSQTLPFTDDYSVDLAQSRVQTSPATLSTTAAGELERIRYVLARLGGVATWDLVNGASPGFPLTNKTGVALVAGDVVAFSSGNDSAVALSDTAGAFSSFVVALESIATDAIGNFRKAGVVSVKAQGAIARLAYVKKSATTRAVETTGLSSNAQEPPPSGALGLALAAAAGGFVTTLWFDGPAMGSGWTKHIPVDAAEYSTGAAAEGTLVTKTVAINDGHWLKVSLQWRRVQGSNTDPVALTLRLNSTNLTSPLTVVGLNVADTTISGMIEWVLGPFHANYGLGRLLVSISPAGAVQSTNVARPTAVTAVTIRGAAGNVANTLSIKNLTIEVLSP